MSKEMLEEKVNQAVMALVPHFGLQNPDKYLIKSISDDESPMCGKLGNRPTVLFLRACEMPHVIAHEVGHFLHWSANPDLPTLNKYATLLEEAVANCSALVYLTGNDPLNLDDQFSEFNLKLLSFLRLSHGERREFNGYFFRATFISHQTLNEYNDLLLTEIKNRGLD